MTPTFTSSGAHPSVLFDYTAKSLPADKPVDLRFYGELEEIVEGAPELQCGCIANVPIQEALVYSDDGRTEHVAELLLEECGDAFCGLIVLAHEVERARMQIANLGYRH